MKKSVLAVLLAGLWVNASEFLRNQVLLPSYWTAHYQSLGLQFPSAPVNGAVWGLWGFTYTGVLFALTRRFEWKQAAALGWVIGFALMWEVLWNLSVLPTGLLPFAVPLSLLEAGLACFILAKLAPRPS